jgi:hypothetical protein
MKYFFLLLLFSFLCLGDLSAQVGINNTNPSQALDVGGKIKVGDDQIAPVAGTIRYNRVTKTFEGYDGTEWSVFNPEEDDGGGNVPASGTIVSGYIATNSGGTGSTNTAILYYNPDGGSFFDIPTGRALYITHINIFPQGGAYNYRLSAINEFGQSVNRTELKIMDTNPTGNQHITDPNGHLMILPSNTRLGARKDQGGNSAIIYVRGFLQ